jgi:3-hydroxyisobutyrate dehydrogenase-like beta-hydroxyacid dehydrogenase
LIQIFVRDDAAVMEVLESMKPVLTRQHLILNHATISVEGARAAAALVAEAGADYLDAPFTGSKMAAENGKLVYYAGGPEPLVERARPLLMQSGVDVLPMGEIGHAAVVKITTNLVSAAIVKALTEAAAITASQGVSLESLLRALEQNANFSPLIGMKLPAIINQEFSPHFSLKNMLKDADFARALAAAAGLSTPVLEATAAAMREKLEAGRGELDFSVLGEGIGQTVPEESAS